VINNRRKYFKKRKRKNNLKGEKVRKKLAKKNMEK
jgi:hypothetical protein